jgi:hypothetical protein
MTPMTPGVADETAVQPGDYRSPRDYLTSLPHDEQRAAITEFLDKLPPLIFTGDSKETSDE